VASRQIGQVVGGLHHSTICKRLKHLTPRKTTEIYKELKADVLAEKQRKLLMTSANLPAREQGWIAKAIRDLNEVERLERGQSTANVSQIDLSDRLREALKRSAQSRTKVDNSVDNPTCQPVLDIKNT